MENNVYIYDGDSNNIKKTITPKNLGWVLKNMGYIEIVELKFVNGKPTLYIAGNREGNCFRGFFPFSDLNVLREWAAKRKYFQYIGVSDLL